MADEILCPSKLNPWLKCPFCGHLNVQRGERNILANTDEGEKNEENNTSWLKREKPWPLSRNVA